MSFIFEIYQTLFFKFVCELAEVFSFLFFSFSFSSLLNWTLIVQVKLRKLTENGADRFRFWETRVCHIYRSYGCKHDSPRFAHFLTRDIIQRNKSHFPFHIGKQF